MTGGALTCLWAQPLDHSRTILESEYVSMPRRFLGIEPYTTLECPCCGAKDVDMHHARICARSGSQVTQHQRLVHAVAKLLKGLAVNYTVEDGVPLAADRDFRMDLVVPAGELKEATMSAYRQKRAHSSRTHVL